MIDYLDAEEPKTGLPEQLRYWYDPPACTGDRRAMEAADEIERLRERVRGLTAICDRYAGTPCAEVRWEQERERLERELAHERVISMRRSTELAEARGLLREARLEWIKVGYGASHEDVLECRDFCDRIDAALASDQPTVSAEWTLHTKDADGNPCVPEHSRVIGGVLCRWWGDEVPPGVALLDRTTADKSSG